jgi:release factor glutamine methyltransferase
MLPIFDTKDSSTKDKIISILSAFPNINTKKINSILKKQYALDVTYQAVHKTLKQMIEQEVLLYEEKSYQINPNWIDSLKLFVQRSEERLEEKESSGEFSDSKSAVEKISELKDMDIINLKFMSIKELDKFIMNFESKFINQLAKENSEIIIAHKHNRLPVMYSEFEKIFSNSFKKKKLSYYIVCEQDTMLDNWAVEIYNQKGIGITLNSNYKIEEDELMMYGDYIIRIYFPKNVSEKIDTIFKRVKGINEFYPEKLFKELFVEKTQFVLSVQKSKMVAFALQKKLKQAYLRKEFIPMISSLKKQKESGKLLHTDVEMLYKTKRQVYNYANVVLPYLSNSELEFIQSKILDNLPKKLSSQKTLNIFDFGVNDGKKPLQIFTNFHKQYNIKYCQISPSKNMLEISEKFLNRFQVKDIAIEFVSSSLKNLPNLKQLKNRKKPSIFFMLDYWFGNYDSAKIISILKSVLRPDDLLILSMQFTPEKLDVNAVKKLLNYYDKRFEGFRYDIGALLEIGFTKSDLDVDVVFNKKNRRIESYSIIKKIPDRLAKEIKDVGLKVGDKIFNYFSWKPSLSMFNEKISKNFNIIESIIDKSSMVGVTFCQLKSKESNINPEREILFPDENTGHIKLKLNEKVFEPTFCAKEIINSVNINKEEFNLPVLDLGTGTGAIGLYLASKGYKKVLCTDLYEPHVDIAKINAKINNYDDRIEVRKSDALKSIKKDEKFALIVSNPPDYCEGMWLDDKQRNNEIDEILICGARGNEFLVDLAKNISNYLLPNGRFVYLILSKNNPPLIRKILENQGMKVKLISQKIHEMSEWPFEEWGYDLDKFVSKVKKWEKDEGGYNFIFKDNGHVCVTVDVYEAIKP